MALWHYKIRQFVAGKWTQGERCLKKWTASACTPHKITISLNTPKSGLDYVRMIRFKTSQLELRKSLRKMALSHNLCKGHVIRERLKLRIWKRYSVNKELKSN